MEWIGTKLAPESANEVARSCGSSYYRVAACTGGFTSLDATLRSECVIIKKNTIEIPTST
jgi:hypothetical protein